jgi:hypothetical protein
MHFETSNFHSIYASHCLARWSLYGLATNLVSIYNLLFLSFRLILKTEPMHVLEKKILVFLYFKDNALINISL